MLYGHGFAESGADSRFRFLSFRRKNAISASKVADKVVNNLGKRKREINLPWTLSTTAKLRAIFPSLFDFISAKFFNFK